MAECKTYNIKQFDGTGFATWIFRIRCLLMDYECVEAITSVAFAGRPEKKLEAKAQNIMGGMADTHLEYIRKENTAYNMVKRLETNFMKKSTQGKLFLRRNLGETMFNEKTSLAKHFSCMEGMFFELADAGAVLSDEEKICFILLSMPKSYEVVVTTLETMTEIKLDFVKERLLEEEEKRQKDNEINKGQNYSSPILGRYYFPANRSLDRGDCAVTIRKVKYEDLGSWTCGAGLDDGQEHIDFIQFEVEGLYAMSTASATGITFGVFGIVGLLAVLGVFAWKKRQFLGAARPDVEEAEAHELEQLPASQSPQRSPQSSRSAPRVVVQSPSEPSESPLMRQSEA